MRRLASPRALATAFSLLLLANAVLLASAAWNRRGGPRAEMALTERELALPQFREEENTALSLALILGDKIPPSVAWAAWQRRTRLPWTEHPWLDREKFREIGWRNDLDPSHPGAEEAWDREGHRSLFLVLEMEGEAWRSWLAGREEAVEEVRRRVEGGAADRRELEEARTLLALDKATRSRLFPVDAGYDPEPLRRRHPDSSRCFIVRGILSPRILRNEGAPPRLDAFIEVLPHRIQIPAENRSRFAPFLPRETRDEALRRETQEGVVPWPDPVPPRYRVDLALGRSFFPWIVRVTPLS